MRISFTWLACAGMILLLQACAETQAPQYFVIRVIDETAAEALRIAKEEAVNAALLVPA